MKEYLSRFYIAQKYGNEMLIFSTLTTSLMIIPVEEYEAIYLKGNFNAFPETVRNLIDNGFIHSEEFDELEYLESLRKKTIANNSGKTNVFMITPTMDCNARCFYCFERGSHHQKMTMDTADAVSDFIANNKAEGTINLQWFGGEPLMATDVIDRICANLQGRGIEYESKLTSNGYLFNETIFEKARDFWNVKYVQFTIDGLEDDYNRIKKYIYQNDPSPFITVMNNIEKAATFGYKIRLRLNFNPNETEKIKGLIVYLRKRFKQYNNLHVYFAGIDSTSNQIPPISLSFDEKKIHPIIELLDIDESFCSMGSNNTAIDGIDSDLYTNILKDYFLHPITSSCFGVCRSSISIDSLGDIYVCHRLLGQGKKMASGSVFEGYKYNEITTCYQNTDIDEQCKQCNLLPLCQGGCKYKRLHYSKEHCCIPIKGVAENMILRALQRYNAEQWEVNNERIDR